MDIGEIGSFQIGSGLYPAQTYYTAQGFYYYHQQHDTITQSSLFSPNAAFRYCFDPASDFYDESNKDPNKDLDKIVPVCPLANNNFSNDKVDESNSEKETTGQTCERPIQMTFDAGSGLSYYDEDSNVYEGSCRKSLGDGRQGEAGYYNNNYGDLVSGNQESSASDCFKESDEKSSSENIERFHPEFCQLRANSPGKFVSSLHTTQSTAEAF